MKKKLNIKINQSINIIESIALVSLLTISLIIYSNIFALPNIVKALISIISIILIGVIISIELFCLMLEKNKYRLITIGYYIITLILLLSLNLLFPFFSLITVLVFNIVKNIYRIKNISTIYEYDKFAAYCKIYNIKTRKPRKKSVSKVSKTVPKKATIKNTTKASSSKKTAKSYA